jgi:alanine racemase
MAVMQSVARPSVTVDLARVQANAQAILQRTGVPLIAVVKADGYGLGARRMVEAMAELAAAFYVLDAAETLAFADLDTGKPTIAMLGTSDDPADYVSRKIRPAVWTVERANQLRQARPILSVDTGQHRFSCPADQVDAVLKTGACEDALTHATTLAQVKQLRDLAGGRVARLHAAGSGLLGEPDAWLDAVRPGFALYEGATRVAAKLLETRDVVGPAGYSGFVSSTGRLGIFMGGYSNGMRAGAQALVNGVRRRIPEIGMQSAFVELGSNDKVGDEVVLLGDGISEREVAAAWNTSPQEALYRLSRVGEKSYRR